MTLVDLAAIIGPRSNDVAPVLSPSLRPSSSSSMLSLIIPTPLPCMPPGDVIIAANVLGGTNVFKRKSASINKCIVSSPNNNDSS